MEPINPHALFPQLAEIPLPPRRLYLRGSLRHGTKLLAVVGSRHCTQYGIDACRSIIAGLSGYPICVVSGLAVGIDTVAHEAALDAGLHTLAFPGSGLAGHVLYPAKNRPLANRIVEVGGGIVSEYGPQQAARPWMFPYRNRLMAGVADAVLVIEATERSGSLITARLGTEYNKTVCAVPGPITSPQSAGTNDLIKQGAMPVCSAADVLRELGLIA